MSDGALPAGVSLLETLALEQGRLRHVDAHLARLAQAARHFGCSHAPARIEAALDAVAQAHPQGLWRLRLLLDAQGTPQVQAFAMDPPPARVRLQLADRPFAEAHSPFSRFKTTQRAHYEAFSPQADGVFDTLLWNAEGEITECTRGNIALQLGDGSWVTPPLHCGLLNGIGRALRLQAGELQEAVVRVDDLPRVQALAFVNSLRGWLPADLVRP